MAVACVVPAPDGLATWCGREPQEGERLAQNVRQRDACTRCREAHDRHRDQSIAGRAIRSREDAVPLRLDPDEDRPVFNIGAVDEARVLARHAERLHREADDEQDLERRAALRRQACDWEAQADAIVPVEYRG